MCLDKSIHSYLHRVLPKEMRVHPQIFLIFPACSALDPAICTTRTGPRVHGCGNCSSFPFFSCDTHPYLPSRQPLSPFLEFIYVHPKPGGFVVGRHELHDVFLVSFPFGDHHEVIVSVRRFRRRPAGAHHLGCIDGVFVHEST